MVKESSTHLNNFAIIPTAGTVSDILISPNSEFIALVFKEKALVMVYSAKGTQIAKIEDTQSGISGVLWAPDSLQLLIFTELLYKCNIYNLQNKTIASIRSPKFSSVKGCVFSSSGKLMAMLERHDCRDTINIYHCGDWKLVNSFQMDSYDIAEIKWSENEAHIVASENPINYRLYALCPYKGIVLRYQPYDFALGIKTMELSGQSKFLAVGSFDEKVRILNQATWKLICELDCSGPASLTDQTKIYK
jgi:WD40 repeat protein